MIWRLLDYGSLAVNYPKGQNKTLKFFNAGLEIVVNIKEVLVFIFSQ